LASLWFLTGVIFTLSSIILMLPWLRTVPGLGSLPALPWQAGAGAVVMIAATAGVWLLLQHPNAKIETQPLASHNESSKVSVASDSGVDSWAGIANALGRGTVTGKGPNTTGSAAQSGAQPMAGAIASLQTRLAKGGGSAGDWELLAKSYEFLGRPADASKVRAHQLPPLPEESSGSTSATAPGKGPSAPGNALSGEVSLAPGLKAKVTGGATLFIVAKSVDSPGVPVAVYRTAADRWPLKFELTDSESMLPGRNLSSAGRVTIEARISQSGQPLPAAGDLQGATGVVDPADHRPLAILIDKVIK
jgi:hypothetical protein